MVVKKNQKFNLHLQQNSGMRYIGIYVAFLIATNIGAQDLIEPCQFGQPLIDALQDQFTPDNTLGYDDARDVLYSEIDNEGNDLSCIYTNFTVTLDPGADPSSSAYQGGSGLNAEHVYPQSLGAGSEPAKSDMHNIRPCKANVNSARGICAYGDIEDSDTEVWYYLDMESSSIPSSNIDSYSEKDVEDCEFEVREEVKGDIARTMFYFYSIYQSTANNANANYFNNQKASLLEWHQNDPVDTDELERSTLIAAQQGNENPFVMDSTLARRAFFMADASYPEGDDDCYMIPTSNNDLSHKNWIRLTTNFVQNEVELQSEKSKGRVALYNIQGRFIRYAQLDTTTSIPTADLPQGLYILQVRSGNLEKAFTIFKQ